MFKKLIGFIYKRVPNYGNWCGPSRTAIDGLSATMNDVPVDLLDCLGWLHDRETGCADSYRGWRKIVAYNTAHLNWVERSKNLHKIGDFSSMWWSKRLNKEIKIPFKWDKDYLKLYGPSSVGLFRVLSIKSLSFMRDQKLLKDAIDESLCGPPPM